MATDVVGAHLTTDPRGLVGTLMPAQEALLAVIASR